MPTPNLLENKSKTGKLLPVLFLLAVFLLVLNIPIRDLYKFKSIIILKCEYRTGLITFRGFKKVQSN